MRLAKLKAASHCLERLLLKYFLNVSHFMSQTIHFDETLPLCALFLPLHQLG